MQHVDARMGSVEAPHVASVARWAFATVALMKWFGGNRMFERTCNSCRTTWVVTSKQVHLRVKPPRVGAFGRPSRTYTVVNVNADATSVTNWQDAIDAQAATAASYRRCPQCELCDDYSQRRLPDGRGGPSGL